MTDALPIESGLEPEIVETPSPLATLVAEYLDQPARQPAEDAAFAGLESLEQAIELAVSTRRGRNGSMLQIRSKKATPDRALPALLAVKDQIAAAKDFDGILNVIEKVFRGIEGRGGLHAYDTARRIGAYMNLFPRRVYLNARAQDGARALRLEHRRPYLNMVSFPPELRKLEPKQVEEFLSLYKAKLIQLAE